MTAADDDRDDLADLVAASQQRERDRRAARRTQADEGEAMVDQLDARRRGQTVDELRQDRAEAAERERLRRLGVRFDR